MSKFFDCNTATLHKIESYAGAVKFSKKECVKVKEISPDAPLEFPPVALRLRRCNAGPGILFFSTEDNMLHEGNYSIKHPSNADLIEVQAEIVYR